jgi:hypothetical protein
VNRPGVKKGPEGFFDSVKEIPVKPLLMPQKMFFHPIAGTRVVAKNVVGKILTVVLI